MKLIYLPSYLLAILWTFFWGNWRWVTKFHWTVQGIIGSIKYRRKMSFMWGRHESPEPIKCDCGWAGPVRWLIHDYVEDGFGDVEPVDECPKCRSEI